MPKPGGFDGDGTGNQRVVKLSGSEASKRTGPGLVLKVMAGDKIRAGTYSWYLGTVDNSAPDPVLPSLASSVLSQLLTGMAGAGKAGAGDLGSNMDLTDGLASFLSSWGGSTSSGVRQPG